MSVVIGEETTSPEDMLAEHDGFGLAYITAQVARDHAQVLVRVPTPDQPAHVHVVGKKTDRTRKQFARFADEHWCYPPLSDALNGRSTLRTCEKSLEAAYGIASRKLEPGTWEVADPVSSRERAQVTRRRSETGTRSPRG